MDVACHWRHTAIPAPLSSRSEAHKWVREENPFQRCTLLFEEERESETNCGMMRSTGALCEKREREIPFDVFQNICRNVVVVSFSLSFLPCKTRYRM